jgi:hypothetical protein
MHNRKVTSALFAASALIAGAFLSAPALAQATPPAAQPKPYDAVAIQLPQPYKDAGFQAFRKQLAGIARKKDRAALGRLISKDFFWIPEDKDTADKSKPPIESFAKAIGLDGEYGWEIVGEFADEATADPNAERAGVICAPGGPKFDQKAADALETATQTQPSDWAFPIRDRIDVRGAPAAPKAGVKKKLEQARVIDTLGLHLIWVYPDPAAKEGDDTVRIVTPSGKVGYVLNEDIRQVYSDQVCYVKEGNAWKIAGVIGNIGGSE